MPPSTPSLSVVVPMLNEDAHIGGLFDRLAAALGPLDLAYEIVCVDDGSTDSTFEKIAAAHERDPRLRAVRLSRNFGKERAMVAGFDACRGQLIVLMDADLQHPPEVIPQMLAKLREGYDVVHAVRRARTGQGLLRRFGSRIFYGLMRRAAEIDVVDGAGDFTLMRATVVNALRTFRESNRYMKGLFAWAGFRTSFVEFDQVDREGGGSRWTGWGLIRLALEGLTSFSMLPLRLTTYAGLSVAATAFVSTAYYFVRFALYGDPIRGYPSLFVGMLFLGAVQLVSLGIIGEYVGRTYLEAKRRPLYFVRETIGEGSALAPDSEKPPGT